MPFKIRIIDIAFSLTIFGLLVYKICSLIKQHLVPFLKKQIQEERESQTNLIEKENLIISNQHKIEIQIRQQHKLLNTLEKNMQIWHQFLLDKKNTKEDFYQKNSILINEKRKIQQQNYTLTHVCRETLPMAMDLAEKELTDRYTKDSGAPLFNNLIENLLIKN